MAQRTVVTSESGFRSQSLKPVPAPGLRIVVLDGVVEPAGRAHDRQRAVALAVHLVEPARLEARGHEEEIAPGLDAVSERLR